MKQYILFFFFGLFFSCKKEVDPETPSGALYKITAKGKLQDSLEYGDGRVSRVLAYSSCETPYSVVEYGYAGEQITFARAGTRGLLSSWSGALCDPNGKFDYNDYSFQLDDQGRNSKVTGENMIAIYTYDGQNATVNITDKDGKLARMIYLKFDNNGNLIERRNSATDAVGLVRYEYDNNPNPMRGLNTYGLPNPFTCANNVVRSLDAQGQILWHQKFTYNATGWPLTRDEGNGAVYQYHYRN